MSQDHTLYTAEVAGHSGAPVDVTADMLDRADIVQIAPGTLHLIDKTTGYRIHIQHADPGSKTWVLTIDGRQYHVRLRDPVESRVHVMGFDRNNHHGRQNQVIAPMPGAVLKLLVTKGEEVAQGQPVLVLEAMKMENVLMAPSQGVIAAIHVSERQTVEKNQLLVALKD